MAAARELSKRGLRTTIFDRNDRPGGLARTEWIDSAGFDVGPHRFFTKSRQVLELWQEVLETDLLEVDRLTRILYGGHMFSYPLKPVEALRKLGIWTSGRALISYARVRLRARSDDQEPANFEEWVIREFGHVLYDIFFRSYTEKVWGVPCDQISKEWAGQRIKGLNLASAIRNSLTSEKTDVRSLVERFYYPRFGAGQLYERMANEIEGAGSTVRLGNTVTKVMHHNGRIESIATERSGTVNVDHLFSSAPITDLVYSLEPAAPAAILAAADRLTYRAHITVNCLLSGPAPFPDNWIYINSPEVRMARVANYRSFSTAMTPDPGRTPISVEYFCFENDELWNSSDEELGKLAESELTATGLITPGSIEMCFVVREPDSYPTYYLGHDEHFDVLFEYLRRFTNLTLMGRAGIYRYNNQDHSLLTGLYAARNYLGETSIDLRSINADDEYLETVPIGASE